MLKHTGILVGKMSELTLTLVLIGGAFGGLGSLAFGVAAIIRESYCGRALLLRAQRGDPETDVRRPTVPRLHRSVRRGGRLHAQVSFLPDK